MCKINGINSNVYCIVQLNSIIFNLARFNINSYLCFLLQTTAVFISNTVLYSACCVIPVFIKPVVEYWVEFGIFQ